MTRPIAAALTITLLAGCHGQTDTAGAGRTEHERDSVIAQSKVPNAAAVRSAMNVQDLGRGRVEREDSVSHAPE